MTMQPNTYPSAPPAAVATAASTGAGLAGYRAAGIVQIVLTSAAGLLWMFSLIGVAMCADGGSSGYCSRASFWLQACFCALLLSLAAGIVLVCVNRRMARRTLHCIAGAAAASALIAAVVGGVYFELVMAPLH